MAEEKRLLTIDDLEAPYVYVSDTVSGNRVYTCFYLFGYRVALISDDREIDSEPIDCWCSYVEECDTEFNLGPRTCFFGTKEEAVDYVVTILNAHYYENKMYREV